AAATATAIGAGSAASGLGAVGSAVGVKALAGVVTAAVITAGAVEVKNNVATTPVTEGINTPSKTVAIAPPVKTKTPERVVAIPPVTEEVVEVEQAVVEPVVTEPVADVTPTVPEETTDPIAETPTHPLAQEKPAECVGDSCVSGEVVDVPTEHAPVDPSAPIESGQIGTKPQAPANPAPPVAQQPAAPTPSNPSPAPAPAPVPEPAPAPGVPAGQIPSTPQG
ncbi:MAG: hypothetical protein WBP55_06215, partial [Solirubrobacterales bacterium]